MWPTDILDTISLSLSIRVYDWSNKNAWIWTHLQCERFCLALITDCHSQKYIRSLRRPFFSTLIFQGHLEEPQRVSFSLAVPCPGPIYLWLGSWDARCFFGHVFPHIMGGISLSAVFHHFDLFKACQIYYSYSACLWWKTKEENIEKKLFK